MKYIYIVFGTLFVVLGMVGAFLPLLPTTPFLLLATALYVRSSERLYTWLINQKLLGPYLRNFMERRAIPLHAKIISITLMWTTMLYCILFLIPQLWIKAALAATAVGISIYIMSFKTLRKDRNQKG